MWGVLLGFVAHLPAKKGVPHISLVFREMWDTTALNLKVFCAIHRTSRFAVSHISRETSEIWGTRVRGRGKFLET